MFMLHALATARIAERGLEGKVEFVLSDYRDLTGPYDRIVAGYANIFSRAVIRRRSPRLWPRLKSLDFG